jgi:hypothetical protein
MKTFIIILFFSFGVGLYANAQGCVAIRSVGGMCTMDHGAMDEDATSNNASAQKWLLNINNRYFKSFRHFVGTDEQEHRIEQGTEVINHAYTMDVTIIRILNKRWSLGMDMPIIVNTRSSLYEHGGKERHTTSSFGLGDIRLAGYYWLLDPVKHSKGNIQAGLGLKLATGNYRYTDRFYTNTAGSTVVGPVDQSIQLGDGGTGITTEINAYYSISRKVNLYTNFYYLINPQETNGTSTARGGTPSASAIANTSDIMSVPDQMMFRGGANYAVNKFIFAAGIRYECLPVEDLLGGSLGFRRPGYIVSAEPGVTYAFKKVNVYAFVPVAITRNRTQSMADKISTANSGKYTHGDAAFADYAVNIGLFLNF